MKLNFMHVLQNYNPPSPQSQQELESFVFSLKLMREKGVTGFKIPKTYKYSLWKCFKSDPISCLNRLTEGELQVLNYILSIAYKCRTVFVNQATIAKNLGLHVKYVCVIISRLHYFGLFFKRQRGLKETCLILVDPIFNTISMRQRCSSILDACKSAVRWLLDGAFLISGKPAILQQPKPVRDHNLTHTKEKELLKYIYYKEDNPYMVKASNEVPICNQEFTGKESPEEINQKVIDYYTSHKKRDDQDCQNQDKYNFSEDQLKVNAEVLAKYCKQNR